MVGGVSQNVMVPSCFSAKIESPQGALLANPHLEFERFDGNRNTVLIKLGSTALISEPAVQLTLELLCDGSMRRTYPLLLNVPELGKHHKPVIAALPDAPMPGRKNSSETRAVAVRSARPGTELNQHADALKISKEISRPPADATTPRSNPPRPPDLEQGRLAANNLAQTAFENMLHDQPQGAAALPAAETLHNEPPSAHVIKTQYIQSAAPVARQPAESATATVPTLWIIVLSMIILILCVAIVAVLFMLNKTGRVEKNNRSAAAPARSASPATTGVQDSTSPAASEQPVPAVPPPEQTADLAAKEKAPGLPTNAFNLFANRAGQSIHIEEISDAVQEAEFWLALKDPHRAIEIMEPQCMGDDPSTPVMWLLLLDLYRTVKNQEKYARLRQRFKRKFNTHILEINETSAPGTVKFLCDFEHLTGKLAAFWNTNYILPFLESLLIDDREGERVGFELSVYQDILMLIAIAKDLEKPVEHSAG